MNTLAAVVEFHIAADQPIKSEPCLTDEKVNELRIKLLEEEVDELKEALEARDPVATLDALIDIQYVLDGAFLSLGFTWLKDDGFREVHVSNMAKKGPDGKFLKREDGKVVKPDGWKPPNLKRIVYGDDR